ncbi:hypothetical protein [Corynebacterium sp. HS2168-gen11]|uniref:hypothetical protein n=1 Tax=Corynebacterium sp. HS2168-gen11 TaxID=2974027 RepID=UPI00216B6573|nr:hypothetical protein [Corynebacterium sp. HS2168-gen11]MCS4534890.1 hypothetical protein [Corynebacterium sp. HS2168-gen11]
MAPRRPRIDNVIFANFHAKQSIRREPEQLTQAQKIHEYGTSDFSRAFSRLILARAEPKRLTRGKTYALAGAVEDLVFRHSVITASVQGSQVYPFEVDIQFPMRTAADFEQLYQNILANQRGIEQLRVGNASAAVLECIFAEAPMDLRLRCSCPDHDACCKHVIATALSACTVLDNNPELALQLRDTSFRDIEHEVIAYAATQASRVQQATPEEFWKGRPLPAIPNVQPQPVIEDSDISLLHQAMRMVSYTGIEELRAVSELEDLYYYLVHEAVTAPNQEG